MGIYLHFHPVFFPVSISVFIPFLKNEQEIKPLLDKDLTQTEH